MGLFKWIKKHPVESALLGTALVLTGGAAGIGPAAGLFAGDAAAGAGAAGAAGAVAGDAFLPGMLAGTEGLAGGSALLGAGTMQGSLANMLAGSLGPSDFTAAMAGDAWAPGYLGAGGTGVPSLGSKAGTLLASGGGMSPRSALMLANMVGSSGQQQPPSQLGAPMDMGNPYQRPALVSQEDIMKKWLLRNDPNTYARLYGQPQGGPYG